MYTETSLLERVNKMCEESLSPEKFEMWKKVEAMLFDNRHLKEKINPKTLTEPPSITELEEIEFNPLTWEELEKFIQELTPEEKKRKVPVLIGDESYSQPIAEAFRIEEDIYAHKDDRDEGGTLEQLRDMNPEEFDESEYEVVTKKGTPFIYIDFF